MKAYTPLLYLFALTGCGASENKIGRLSHSDTFHQAPTNMVDVLWVIDNSSSMADEQAKIGRRFGDFVVGLNDAEVDWHMGVVSTDIDDPYQAGMLQGEPTVLTPETENYSLVFLDNVQLGIGGSDKEKGIDAAFKVFQEPLISNPEANGGFRREGAMLMINFFSDENDCTDRGGLAGVEGGQACYSRQSELVPMTELVADYRDLVDDGERLIVNSIVGPAIAEGCQGSKPGTRYKTMAQAFGGLRGNICETDFGAIMEEIGLQAGGLNTSFIHRN